MFLSKNELDGIVHQACRFPCVYVWMSIVGPTIKEEEPLDYKALYEEERTKHDVSCS